MQPCAKVSGSRSDLNSSWAIRKSGLVSTLGSDCYTNTLYFCNEQLQNHRHNSNFWRTRKTNDIDILIMILTQWICTNILYHTWIMLDLPTAPLPTIRTWNISCYVVNNLQGTLSCIGSKELEIWFQNLDPKLANTRMAIVPTLSAPVTDHVANIFQCGGYVFQDWCTNQSVRYSALYEKKKVHY